MKLQLPECYSWGAFNWVWLTNPLATVTPDSTSLYCCLCGHLEYATAVGSHDDLVAQLSVAVARVREISGIFERIRELLH